MVENDDTTYTVGYGKPPRHTQFKPGQSGNLSGRPKNEETVDDVLDEELNSLITITEGRKRRRLSKRRVAVRQYMNKAASGNIKAVDMLFKLRGSQKSDQGDNLGVLAQEFRARHQRLISDQQVGDETRGPDERNDATEAAGPDERNDATEAAGPGGAPTDEGPTGSTGE